MISGVPGWLGWSSTSDRAHAAAEIAVAHGATGVVVHRGDTHSVVRVNGGDPGLADALVPYCDVSLYRTATRHVLRHLRTWPDGAPTPGVTMLFSVHRRPGMSADAFHEWWERSHAPIALRHHVGMWDYSQVSVVETVVGEPWDGFAVTLWPTLDDLMHRFSSGPEGTEALRSDAAQFTDPTTLHRHLMDELVVVDEPWPVVGEVPVGLARSAELPDGGTVPEVALPDGLSLEVRLTSEGRRRLDSLWRRVVGAGDVADLSGQFDAWWNRVGFPAQPSSSS